MAKKLNCWEFFDCGREPGGENVDQLGECPAAKVIEVKGVHDGRNAGRCCWAVTGTFCEGEIQGTFAIKIDSCEKCDFYKLVYEEEGDDIVPPIFIIHKMNKGQ